MVRRLALLLLVSACTSYPGASPPHSPAGASGGSGGTGGGGNGGVAAGGSGGSAAGGSGGVESGGSGGSGGQGGTGGDSTGGSGGVAGEGGSGGTGGDGCDGAGVACDTGLSGACADGVTRCPPGQTDALCLPRDAAACTPAAPVLEQPRAGAYTGSAINDPDAAAVRPLFAWDPVPGATDYELELDDSCQPGEVRSCTFPSHEYGAFIPASAGTKLVLNQSLAVSTTPPVGRFYAWRVRACIGPVCSDWSVPRALHVGRLPDDFDGDGRSDALLAAPALGEVQVRYAGRIDTIGAEAVGAKSFGRAVAFAGDVNGDGFADALVSGSSDEGVGAAFLLLGGPDGLSADQLRTSKQVGDYGAAVSYAGDLDGDGLDDVAVSSLDGNGSVVVHFGQSSHRPVILEGPQHLDHYGATLGPAYLDHGQPGLMVGAPFLEQTFDGDLFLGAVFVHAGSADGVVSEPVHRIDNPESVRFSKDFGSAMASTPEPPGPGGRPAYAISARIGNDPDRLFTCDAAFTCTRLEAAGKGGVSMAFLRNFSQVDALAIGEASAEGGGQVTIFIHDGATWVPLGHVTGGDDAGRFGAALAAADFAGSGAPQLLVGAPGGSKAYLFDVSTDYQLQRRDVVELAGIGSPLALLERPLMSPGGLGLP